MKKGYQLCLDSSENKSHRLFSQNSILVFVGGGGEGRGGTMGNG